MSCSSIGDSTFSVSLFERLEADAPILHPSLELDWDAVLNSIKRNITHLLNTRQGEAQSAPQLGLIDFNDAALTARDMALTIRRAIRHCLLTYEPRISDVEINIVSDSSTLLGMRFQLLAMINIAALAQPVEIDLLLDSNKKYRVV